MLIIIIKEYIISQTIELSDTWTKIFVGLTSCRTAPLSDQWTESEFSDWFTLFVGLLHCRTTELSDNCAPYHFAQCQFLRFWLGEIIQTDTFKCDFFYQRTCYILDRWMACGGWQSCFGHSGRFCGDWSGAHKVRRDYYWFISGRWAW